MSISILYLLPTVHSLQLFSEFTINTYAARPSAEASEALRSAADEERPQGATTRSTVHSSACIMPRLRSKKQTKIIEIARLRSKKQIKIIDMGRLRSKKLEAEKITEIAQLRSKKQFASQSNWKYGTYSKVAPMQWKPSTCRGIFHFYPPMWISIFFRPHKGP